MEFESCRDKIEKAKRYWRTKRKCAKLKETNDRLELIERNLKKKRLIIKGLPIKSEDKPNLTFKEDMKENKNLEANVKLITAGKIDNMT